MPHQMRFREGWQAENLARFVLYKFCFVAQPAAVCDDLGSDFLCTIFCAEPSSSQSLVPRSSFAIQIKKKNKRNDPIDFTNKIPYLRSLEIPFFVGVADLGRLSVSFYSGEYIPHLFSQRGEPSTLWIKLCDCRDDASERFLERPNDDWTVYFPKIDELPGCEMGPEVLRQWSDRFASKCTRIQANLSAKVRHEYSFLELERDEIYIFRGRDSLGHFEENFVNRWAEFFWNLRYLYDNCRSHFREDVFRAHEKLYDQLYGPAGLYRPEASPHLSSPVDYLKAELGKPSPVDPNAS